MKIAICDDEKTLCEQLRNLIQQQKTAGKIDAVDFYETGGGLLAASKHYDMIFLDIRMEGVDGIETARTLRGRKEDAVLIFVTGLKDYVFEAFDVAAFHYLLKPLREEKFAEVFERAVEEVEKIKRKEAGKEAQAEQLLIRRKGRSIRLEKAQVLYVESRQRKALLHTARETIEIYATMNALEKELGEPFYRCHRGYLVNLSCIAGYTGDTITVYNGENIYLAREKYQEFVKRYMRYLRDGGTICV
ncbi:MAG: LytTR family DNA-binding domain-containing protein [Blautia sp.]|nr:LytTR family DNA-binding domain-containing protein [Blautia sp.]MCM1200630.1 LytTR family DNA-binding domain-containing protein [Bacteroides fragilis]